MSGSRPGAENARPAPLFYALIALTLAAPLPLGAYPVWAWAGMAAACGALMLGWGVSTLAGRLPVTRPPPFLRWSAAALGLAMLWGLLQTAGFTPQGWHHPVWSDTAEALGTPYRGSISLDPAAGRESLLRMATYAVVFWLAFQYGRHPRRARFALRALAAGSACYALYGLGVLFSGAERILWIAKTDYADAVTSTFVNPNSFGAYCGMGLLCATAVLRRVFVRSWPGRAGFTEGLRYALAEFIPRNGLWLAAWLALASALLLSLSRGAVASTALAVAVLLCLLALRRGRFPRIGLSSAIAAVLAAGLLLLLAGEGLERRMRDLQPDWPKRSEIYSQTLEAIGEAPVAGTGLGTFASVYRSHRTEEIRPGVLMAHNDYLELALELGIPAAAVLMSAFLLLVFGCWRGVRLRRRNGDIPALGVALCTLMGAHSLVDFSMQIPAVAATFSLATGVAAAQAFRTGAAADRP